MRFGTSCGIFGNVLVIASHQSDRVFMTYTKRITYSKEMLEGNLAGMCLRNQTILTTDDAVGIHLARLNRMTKANPGHDAGTGNAFWVYNIACEDLTDPAGEGWKTVGGSYLRRVNSPLDPEAEDASDLGYAESMAVFGEVL